jgi:hypothetical protein
LAGAIRRLGQNPFERVEANGGRRIGLGHLERHVAAGFPLPVVRVEQLLHFQGLRTRLRLFGARRSVRGQGVRDIRLDRLQAGAR